MEAINCKSCGKLFNYLGGPPLCHNCMQDMEVKFQEVKEYIYDHPGAGIKEVSDENEVSTSQIKKWVREERLCFSDDSPIGLECESCGKIIKTGRFCPLCKESMKNTLNNVYPEKRVITARKAETKENAKMRFFDNK